MATILDLATSGALVKIEVELELGCLPQRSLYAFPVVIRWLDEVLPNLEAAWSPGRQTPLEQVDFLFSEFIGGADISHYERCHIMKPLDGDHFIWELKTPDIRFFGWFAVKNTFVIGQVEAAGKIKEFGLYTGMRNVCVHLRNELDLDAPKFVRGVYQDVLSA